MSPVGANQGIHVALCAPPIMLENVLVWAPFTPQSGINKSVAWAEPLEGAQTTQSAIATVRYRLWATKSGRQLLRIPQLADGESGRRKSQSSRCLGSPNKLVYVTSVVRTKSSIVRLRLEL